MSFVTLQTETPKGAVAAPTVAAAPPSPVLTADSDAQSPDAKSIQLTVRALKRIRVAMAKEGIAPNAGGLRLGITGGGCSGLSYNIRFDSQPRERDRVFAFSQSHLDAASASSSHIGGQPQTSGQPAENVAPAASSPPIRIFVDPKSFIYLSGMILDYEETLMRQGFNFINPHSTKSCGCGSSFST